jgi:hypothetical protein
MVLSTAASAAAAPAPCTNTWTGAGTDSLWSDAGNWSNGAPGTSDIVCAGAGAAITLDVSPTVAGLELNDATLSPQQTQTLTVTNELDLEAGGSPDVLGAGLALVSSGTATVDPNLDVCLASTSTLTNSGTLTLGDGAELGGAAQGSSCPSGTTGGSVTNNATIASTATSTQATIDNLTTATGSTLTGPGTLDVDSSLSMPSGSGGQIALTDNLDLTANGATGVGANVQVCEDPTATLVIGSDATVTLGQYADLGATDTIACEGGSGGGQITNGGTITVPSSATIAPAFFDEDGAVDVTGGTLSISGSSSSGGDGDTGTYAVSTGAVLNFSGTNRIIDYGGSSGGTFSGGGTLVVSSGLTDFQSDADLASLSHFQVDSGAAAEVDATLGAPATGAENTTIDGDLDGDGSATIPAGSTLSLVGSLAQLGEGIDVTNRGSVSVTGSARVCIDQEATLENEGTLTLGSNSSLGDSATNTICDPSGSLLNDQGATITSAGGSTIDTETFDNAGAVAVTGGTLVLTASNEDTDTGSYAVSSGATISVQGSATRVLEGTLSGSGRLALAGSGTSLEIMPDASGSIGLLSVGSGATLQLDAGPSTPLQGSPAPINVAGTATLDGTVAFNGDALIAPSSDETLELLTYGARAGTPPATPADDNGWSATVAPTGITALITPPPPENTTPPSISGTPAVGGTLTLTQGTWSGSPSSTSITDQWEDCDPMVGECAAISGATGTSYAPTDDDVGEQLEVVETATNVSGSTTASSAMTGAVTSLTPFNSVLPEIDGDEGFLGETLTEIPGEWANALTVTLQWEDCDVTGTICTPIAGATGATYTTTENDANDTIDVVETATNSYGTVQATAEPTSLLLDLSDDDYGGYGDDGGTGYGGSAARGTASVSLTTHTVSGTGVVIDLSCPRHSSCPVTLTLTASEPVASAKKAHAKRSTKRRMVIVGSETVRVTSGQRRAVTVSLNRTGTELLDSEHTLHTVLTATSHSKTLDTERVAFTRAAHTKTSHHKQRSHKQTGHHKKTSHHTKSSHRKNPGHRAPGGDSRRTG